MDAIMTIWLTVEIGLFVMNVTTTVSLLHLLILQQFLLIVEATPPTVPQALMDTSQILSTVGSIGFVATKKEPTISVQMTSFLTWYGVDATSQN